MNVTPRSTALAFLASAALLAGCTSARSTLPIVQPGQVGTPLAEERGIVVEVKDVLIQAPSRSTSATGPGATIGSAVGVAVATANPIRAATAVGSVVGGIMGAKADDKVGEEITIETRNGSRITVIQERTSRPMLAGDRVRILSGTPRPQGQIFGGATGGTHVEHDDDAVAQFSSLARLP